VIVLPYPNEHACRLRNPDDFEKDSFRRIEKDGLSIIIAKLKGESETSAQAYRYPIEKWSEEKAKTHCEKNNGIFEEASPHNDRAELILTKKGDTVEAELKIPKEMKSELPSETIIDVTDQIKKGDDDEKMNGEFEKRFTDLEKRLLTAETKLQEFAVFMENVVKPTHARLRQKMGTDAEKTPEQIAEDEKTMRLRKQILANP
jgi:hypothetical protein